MAAKKESYGKSYGSKWRKYLLWYVIIGIIVYILIWYFYFGGSSTSFGY